MASRALSSQPLQWSRNIGRNGFDSPRRLLPDQVVEALNVMLQRDALGVKRWGSAAQSFSGDSFSGYNALGAFVPGQNLAAAELHFVDRSAPPKYLRVAAGTAVDELTLADAIASRPQDVSFANLNGKMYAAFDSTVNRLHVFDPGLSTTAVRRVGMGTPAAPSVADQGTGTYAATERWYQVRFRVKNGSTLQRQGEASPATSFTPDGSSASARVTKPTSISEDETHWVVEASATEDGPFYEIAEIAVGTTTYDDDNNPDEYHTLGDAAPLVGAFKPWPSVKYLLSDGNRLFGFGVHESSAGAAPAPRAGRVYYSPALDTTDFDDDERVSDVVDGFRGYIDLSRNAGAEDRAIAGPVDGQVFAFQSRGAYMLVGTGDPQQPVRRITLSPRIGAVGQESTFVGEDENGKPCLYFLDPVRGPYRYGRNGLEWCGYDIQDIWSTFNAAAGTKAAHGVYDEELGACLWWIATGSSAEPDTLIVFFPHYGFSTGEGDGVRSGWVKWTGDLASARCSVLFAATIGATMSHRRTSFAGFASKLLRLDKDETDDGGTAFQAYVESGALPPGLLQVNKTLGLSYLFARAAAGVSIRMTLNKDFGADSSMVDDVDLTASGTETRVLRKFQAAQLTEAMAYQVRLGDSAAVSNAWTLEEWTAANEVTDEER